MPKTYICFVWHQHQPFYKDLISGEYHLPWTRMHGLKDYYGMVKVLEDFPHVHQTFNLVPSMLVQIEDYVSGKAVDPFLRVALKPAESLIPEERAFILRYFFQAHIGNMVRRYPRYGELYDLHQAGSTLSAQAIRDLQVLSQVAWFDEEYLAHDKEVRDIIAKGSGYTLEDQAWMGRKQREILSRVLPVHGDFARRGQIEISTTPFYHPILPLVCDTQIAQVPHPGVPLPPQFRYPDDAREQLKRSREYMKHAFGTAPVGLWPSEGSVSDQALELAYDAGFRWAATDNGVLGRTLQRTAGIDETYRPYRWRSPNQPGRELGMIFRDHFLSDLIGFVYSKMDAEAAAGHFLDRIRENAAHLTSRGEDALVPVILDGENAWEHYHEGGRPFLRRLYQMISDDLSLEAVTVSEALERIEPRELNCIFPGSWINANFDIWIGAEEDNKAWEHLLEARRTFDDAAADPITPESRALAYEELLIAEGSDWNWWYGPEHSSDNEVEFDRLYRSHLANVYHALGRTPPEALSRPILRTPPSSAQHWKPAGPVNAAIDGRETSYFEWLLAGVYRPDRSQGSMHGQQSPLTELRYGRSAEGSAEAESQLFLRLDLQDPPLDLRVHLRFESGVEWDVSLGNTTASGVSSAYARLLEIAVPLPRVLHNGTIRLQLSLWNGPLPVDALPGEGWLELG